jgi:hypothetical protein
MSKTDDATVKGLSYVGQIMSAYKAAEAAGASALGHALECGKHLNSAYEVVGKSKWTGWRKVNIPEISQETISVYMRLANALEANADVFSDCTSIRAAIKKVPKTRERGTSTGNGAEGGTENSSTATNSTAPVGGGVDC